MIVMLWCVEVIWALTARDDVMLHCWRLRKAEDARKKMKGGGGGIVGCGIFLLFPLSYCH